MAKIETEYYDLEDAIKMLPLVKAYCRDFKRTFCEAEGLSLEARRIAGMTAPSKEGKEDLQKRREDIRSLLEAIKVRYIRWKDELTAMSITICNLRLGRLNIPIFCDSMLTSINLCVQEDTIEENLEWHQHGDSCEKAKPYMTEQTV